MSRGLQMLVEEGEHSSCVHAVRTVWKQNLPPFFAEMSVGKQNLPLFSSKNGKNYVFRGRNHQKSLKTANSVGRIIKKRRKLQIPWTESSENGKNRLSSTDDERKTVKTAFLPREKVRISHFLRFSLERKSESPIFYVSP